MQNVFECGMYSRAIGLHACGGIRGRHACGKFEELQPLLWAHY